MILSIHYGNGKSMKTKNRSLIASHGLGWTGERLGKCGYKRAP